MIDLSGLEVGATVRAGPKEEAHDFTPQDGDGNAYLNGAGEPLVLRIADPGSPRARREMVKLRLKFPDVEEPEGGWTEAALDRAARHEEGRQDEMLARFVVGWNVRHGEGGDPVEFSVDHMAQFFRLFPAVHAATMVHLSERMRQAGNSAGGSRPGPRKKAGSRGSTGKQARRDDR